MKKVSAIMLSIIFILSAAVPSSAAAGTNIGTTAEDGTINIADDFTGIRTEVSSETLDGDAYAFLRGYFNDYSLTEDQLFDRFFELKKSYMRALESLYNVNYLSNSKKKSETALHIYYEGSDTLFGIDGCGVYLYNISVYNGLKHTEESHLDLIIPIRSTNTIEMVRFTIPQVNLGTIAAAYVAYVLSELRIDGAFRQHKAPSILYSGSLTEDAKLGIYPAEYQKDPTYISFEDPAAGYGIHLPYSYVPFIRNNLGGDFTFDSYKISPNLVFSITSEPVSGNGAEDAIARFRVTSLTSVKILENGSSYYGNNNYHYIYYTNLENGIKKYYYDYYIQNGKKLYKLQLTSAYAEPGKNITRQLDRILAGFDYRLPAAGGKKPSTSDVSMQKYLNSEEGYSFEYPENWRLEDISSDISYDRLRLVVPGMSGALDVTFQESGIIESANFIDIIKSVEGNSVSSWPNITIGYKPPFAGKMSRLLFSDFRIDGPVSTVYRLSAFVDDNGRNRLCYSVDILKGKKIYSMFITSAEYSTENGYFSDTSINGLLNKAAASFRLENTPESQERAATGETRNRKLILVEKYLRDMIAPLLKITSVGDIQPDNTMFVTAENTFGNDGYYRVRLDYSSGSAELVDRTLKSSILRVETGRLLQQYKGNRVISSDWDESKMLITIKYEDKNFPVVLTHVYLVDVAQNNGRLSWVTKRIANQEDYIRECGLYVKSIFSPETNVYIYGSSTFKDLEAYRRAKIPYRVFTYEQYPTGSGFMLISMNPVTSIFSAAESFVPMDDVVRMIEQKYGIQAAASAGGYKFDTEKFTLTLPVSGDREGKAGTRQFRVYYDLDNSFIDFEPVG